MLIRIGMVRDFFIEIRQGVFYSIFIGAAGGDSEGEYASEDEFD